MRYPFASQLIQELGPTLGMRVKLEPEYGFAGELVFQMVGGIPFVTRTSM